MAQVKTAEEWYNDFLSLDLEDDWVTTLDYATILYGMNLKTIRDWAYYWFGTDNLEEVFKELENYC